MHMVDGEHGHSHSACGAAGEHSHEHTHTHTHPHTHEGEHAHGHTHEGEHSHEHTHTHAHPHTHEAEHVHEHGCGQEHSHGHGEHGCQGCPGGCEKPANEQEAILAYMLDHNRHHAAELMEIAKQFRTVGKEEAAIQIEKAVEDFEKGNMRLSVALSLVKAPQ